MSFATQYESADDADRQTGKGDTFTLHHQFQSKEHVYIAFTKGEWKLIKRLWQRYDTDRTIQDVMTDAFLSFILKGKTR